MFPRFLALYRMDLLNRPAIQLSSIRFLELPMLTVKTVVFCEKLMTLADGRQMAIGIYPGALMFNAPNGHLLMLDALIAIGSDLLGEFEFEFKLMNTDGSQIGEAGKGSVGFKQTDEYAHINLNMIQAPIHKPGAIVLMFREGSRPFVEVGRIGVRMAHVATAGQGLETPGALIS